MLMGSTGVVRPILPKSMVANLRYQSIINMNETKDSAITLQDITTPWNSNFSRLSLKLMGYELKNTN
jgi:hypothetical protein